MKRFAIVFLVLILAAGYAACGDGGDEPTALDSDGDGWTDAWEKEIGSDPFNTDTDGDGHRDSLDCDPLDPTLPAAETPSPTATTAPLPSPAATPTRTPSPVRPGPAEPIPAGILNECSSQFLSENEDVSSSAAYQSSDAGTIFLLFSIHQDVPHDRMKPLGEEFVRLVKSKVDIPPGLTLGPGKYNYVPYVDDASGVRVIQGTKCAECDAITWQ